MKTNLDDQLEQPVVGSNETGTWRRRSTFSGEKFPDQREDLFEAIAPGICVCIYMTYICYLYLYFYSARGMPGLYRVPTPVVWMLGELVEGE